MPVVRLARVRNPCPGDNIDFQSGASTLPHHQKRVRCTQLQLLTSATLPPAPTTRVGERGLLSPRQASDLLSRPPPPQQCFLFQYRWRCPRHPRRRHRPPAPRCRHWAGGAIRAARRVTRSRNKKERAHMHKRTHNTQRSSIRANSNTQAQAQTLKQQRTHKHVFAHPRVKQLKQCRHCCARYQCEAAEQPKKYRSKFNPSIPRAHCLCARRH